MTHISNYLIIESEIILEYSFSYIEIYFFTIESLENRITD